MTTQHMPQSPAASTTGGNDKALAKKGGVEGGNALDTQQGTAEPAPEDVTVHDFIDADLPSSSGPGWIAVAIAVVAVAIGTGVSAAIAHGGPAVAAYGWAGAVSAVSAAVSAGIIWYGLATNSKRASYAFLDAANVRLGTLRDQQTANLARVTDAHADAMKQLRDAHAEDLRVIGEENTAARDQLRDAHRIAIQALEEAQANEIQRLQRENEAEIRALEKGNVTLMGQRREQARIRRKRNVYHSPALAPTRGAIQRYEDGTPVDLTNEEFAEAADVYVIFYDVHQPKLVSACMLTGGMFTFYSNALLILDKETGLVMAAPRVGNHGYDPQAQAANEVFQVGNLRICVCFDPRIATAKIVEIAKDFFAQKEIDESTKALGGSTVAVMQAFRAKREEVMRRLREKTATDGAASANGGSKKDAAEESNEQQGQDGVKGTADDGLDQLAKDTAAPPSA